MNVENICKWIAALRSGDYKQGLDNLRSFDDRYCCLGVGCEVAGIEAVWDDENKLYRYGGLAMFPPAAFYQWLGLLIPPDEEITDLNDNVVEVLLPTYTSDWGWEYSLSVLNDDQGYTFDQIADLIEEWVNEYELRPAERRIGESK